MNLVTNTKTSTSINTSNIILAALAILGGICWGIQLTKGLQVTNLGTSNMWGIYIVGFMIFTGVAAGSLLFASAPYLFNLDEFKPYSRIAAFLAAISSIVVASLFIMVDIGSPWRVWLFITSGNFSSPMFWDFIILASYMIISVIFTYQLIKVKEGSKDESSLKTIALIAFIAGLLVVVTSFVFSMQNARPIWNTPVQPVSFLVAE
ncbi:MAG: polysulfide reductase NrfD, partial [Syntrophomonadaceae bacterium]|nr:polysulfide reductase NrfD [Syntrophomonadaceae bacterium]